MSFSPLTDESTTRIFQRIETCIAEIRTWLKNNKLMLNDDKTDVLVISSVSMRSKLQVPQLKIGSSIVTPSPVERNIGLYMNSVMDMEQQVQKICQSCYFQIFSIGKIRHLLNNKSTEILVHAFIPSRLDNGNALLYGISKYLLAKLQRVQNAAARLITRTKKQEHITPVLVSLHWLPIKQRIQYKLLLLAYRVIHGHGSSYLAKLLKPHEPSRQLRSEIKISWLCLAARAALMGTGLSRVLFHVYGMLCLTQCVKSLHNTLLKNV